MITLLSCIYMYLNRVTSNTPVLVRVLDRLSINNGFGIISLFIVLVLLLSIDNLILKFIIIVDVVFLSYFFLNYLRSKIELVSLDYIKPKVFHYVFTGFIYVLLIYSYINIFI